MRSAGTKRDDALTPKLNVFGAPNLQVYEADIVCHKLNRQGVAVARCTVERLMRCSGLKGLRRGKVVRTTVGDPKAACPRDRRNRPFKADRPKKLWVSESTYVSTWQFVAFVIDVFARSMSSSMRTDLVLDALEQALLQTDNQLIE